MAGKQASFWLAVAGVSVIAPVVVNIAVDRLGIPALTTLNAYATRANGIPS